MNPHTHTPFSIAWLAPAILTLMFYKINPKPNRMNMCYNMFVCRSPAMHTKQLTILGGCIGSRWGKPEGKRPLERPMGRPRCRWVDNIRTDLQEVGCGYKDWIGLAQDRDSWRTLVSAVMNLRVP